MKILCLLNYYLPSYKAGGPIRTIENMVNNLSEGLNFLIYTRDRELDASEPFSNIEIDEWNRVGNADVFYVSPNNLTIKGLQRLLNDTEHDVLYLNSFFDHRFTFFPLLLKYLNLYSNKSIVIAPRGEFSKGALKIKKKKKDLFIFLVKFLGIYNNLTWQASSEFELEDIVRVLDVDVKDIVIAPVLLPSYKINDIVKYWPKGIIERNNILNIVFLSRITRKKNLDYLLRILSRIEKEIYLSVYGPIAESKYWNDCLELVGKLPANIRFEYKGEIRPEKVAHAFSMNDVFVFPTHGENFGHVIYESISAGTPVILSDQTPWVSDKNGSVEVISLNNENEWVKCIERWSMYSSDEKSKIRIATFKYLRNYLENSSDIELNEKLFITALKK